MSRRFFSLALLGGVCLSGFAGARQTPPAPVPASLPAPAPIFLPTGKQIAPLGSHTPVGSFPANALLSPDGKFLVVTTTGFRQFLSVVRIADGRVVSRIAFNGQADGGGKQKDQLYYGLAFGAAKDGITLLYASCGGLDCADVFTLDAGGVLTDTAKACIAARRRPIPRCLRRALRSRPMERASTSPTMSPLRKQSSAAPSASWIRRAINSSPP